MLIFNELGYPRFSQILITISFKCVSFQTSFLMQFTIPPLLNEKKVRVQCFKYCSAIQQLSVHFQLQYNWNLFELRHIERIDFLFSHFLQSIYYSAFICTQSNALKRNRARSFCNIRMRRKFDQIHTLKNHMWTTLSGWENN